MTGRSWPILRICECPILKRAGLTNAARFGDSTKTNRPETLADVRPVSSVALSYGQLVSFTPSWPSVVETDANDVLFARPNTHEALLPLSFGPAMPGWFV
jgi:hypothetical protein